MATADSVKTKMQGLIDSANAKTGASDATLTAAVNTLIAGFGSGGGGGASGIYMAKVTPSEYLGNLTIAHNLGTTDILYVAAWTETLGELLPDGNATLCKMWAKTDITTRRGGNGFSTGYNWIAANQYADTSSPNTAGYETLSISDENTVVLPRVQSGSTAGYHAGITYTVLVIAASAFSGV